jgi:methenyltetrahydrofolate cyclohydrolase
MKLIDLKITQFIDEVDSKSPAPGGGSVSALYATLGIALMRMVGHLTIDKKKFKALDEDIQKTFVSKLNELLELKDAIIKLIDEDTKAFNEIMNAYGLPKTTDAEASFRNNAIIKATQQAIIVPQTIANLSLRAIEDMDVIISYGNQMAISDVGVGVLGLCAAIEGACLNVLINLPGLEDEQMIATYKNEVEVILTKTHKTRDQILSKVYQKLN